MDTYIPTPSDRRQALGTMIQAIVRTLLGAHGSPFLSAASSVLRHCLTIAGGAIATDGTLRADQALQVSGTILAALPVMLSVARHWAGSIALRIDTWINRRALPSSAHLAGLLFLLAGSCIGLACSSITLNIGSDLSGAGTNAVYRAAGTNIQATASMIILINQSVPKDITSTATLPLLK